MAFKSKIRALYETIVQIGKGGVQIKNNAGTLEVRDPTDAAYAITRGADPVGNNDYLTLQFFNAHNAAAVDIAVVDMTLAEATKISSVALPDNAMILWTILDVTTAYNGTAPTFKVTRTGDGTKVLTDTGDSDLTSIDQYEVPKVQSWGATGAGTVTATFAGAAVTLGAATLYIAYVTPTDIS